MGTQYIFVPGVSDPRYGSRVLLCHCNGSNGSSTYTDDSIYHATQTSADCTQSTTSPLVGTASSVHANTSVVWPDEGAAAPDSKFSFDTEDWTVEGVIMRTADGADAVFMNHMETGIIYQWILRSFYSGGYGYLQGIVRMNDFTIYTLTSSSAVLTLNTAIHFALCREGTNLSLFAGAISGPTGNRVGLETGLGTVAMRTTTAPVRMGSGDDVALGTNFVGKLDEVRITKGYAEYSGATYTIPTFPFPNSG